MVPSHNRRNKSYCSNGCRLAALNAIERIRRDPAFNRRQLTCRGYVRIWDGTRLVMEHRWVMEQHLGRPLDPQERVHHRNSDRADNNLGNLVLYPTQAAHIRSAHPDLVRNLPGRD